MRTATAVDAWRTAPLVQTYLTGVRGAIPLAQTQFEVMLALLATRPQPVARFLDLGCGDGVLAAAILATYPAARGVCADFSPPMLAACRAKLAPWAAQLALVEVDYSLPAWVALVQAHGPFDAIVSGFSIHHQPDERKRTLYRELHDLLAPGGWFVNVEHVAPQSATTTALFDDAMIAGLVAGAVARGETVDRATVRQRYIDRPDKEANRLAPVDAQCQWLRAAGLAEVDCYFKLYELAVFAGRRPLA